MNEFDRSQLAPLALDGHGLQVFLAVLETGSVTAAAEALGVSQSAVSHTLEKLRGLLHDPLFVKSGRGIVATAHAAALAEPARRLLDDMTAFTRGSRFEPKEADLVLTVAANDFQRDLLLPAFRARVAAKVRSLLLAGHPLACAHGGASARASLRSHHHAEAARGLGHLAEAAARGPHRVLLRR